MDFKIIFFLVGSYLIGSIPFAYIITKTARGIDIRNFGSGNPGATNVFRVAGKTYGLITLMFDFLKGLITVSVTKLFYPDLISISIICGLLSIIGHNWPVWLKFRGGKGFATSLGVLLGLIPLVTFFGLITFVIIFILTKYVSLSSVLSSIVVIAMCWIKREQLILCLFVSLTGLMIIIRHRPNIVRLLKGTESKLKI
ncbi:MAG: acyl-phosphate glycerol 3-phosphate acyltransferase [Elusimicrobia bacterium CG1_02_37_114]|nr:MAG: acyl-phosphate glycerol 3-phosphate acyltransferase [Elusimicrobia bacterium CG1_02_37_114]PIZ13362.1 MAG: acyl-phosphate glycerol 3-phosphate acyltransferase [Elusimicrobia bacterium CG_4_10_14_0_8_um_filter_37_32]